MKSSTLTAYEAAQTSAAFIALPAAGYLRLAGPDQVTFLQRQTTNDMRLLKPGQALLNVLTSPTARILDVFYMVQEPWAATSEATPGAIALLPTPGQADATARYLKSRIFFMDKVTVTDASSEFNQLDLLGPESGRVLEHLGVKDLPASGRVTSAAFEEAELYVLAAAPSYGLGYRLLVPPTRFAALVDALQAAGAASLDAEGYETLRVEAGLPAAGRELTETYTPLETGLKTAISDNKGCYTGQEIIARQITYDKVTQKLCGLRLSQPASPGARIWAEDKPAGHITSTTVSPHLGPVALAIIKRPYFEPGTAVLVGDTLENAFPAQVEALPFLK